MMRMEAGAYLSHNTSNTVFGGHGGLPHAEALRTGVTHISLHEPSHIATRPHCLAVGYPFHRKPPRKECHCDLPRIHDQARNVGVLKMNLAYQPVRDGLATAISRHGERAQVLAADTPEGTSDADEFGAALVSLLKQG